MRSILRSVGSAAAGGLYGAVALTVLRLFARRAGLVDKMVPDLIEEWVLREPSAPGTLGRHHAVDRALHLASGAAWGALAGPSLATARRGSFLWGAGLGAGLWAASLIAPHMRRTGPRDEWMVSGPARMASLLAHVLYGLSVQLAARQVRPEEPAPRSQVWRRP